MPLSDGRRVHASGPKPTLSLVDVVHQQLRERIILGEIHGGEMLVESKLAEEFGVSKTPVREALVLLSQQRYVAVIPRQGYRVTTIMVKDIHEVYEFRCLLEPEAAALAASRAVKEEVEALGAEMSRISAELRSKGTKVTALEVISVDDEFHMGIANLAGNGRLSAAIHRLLREAVRFRFADPHESPEGMLSEGQTTNAILDAIGKKDASAARQLMNEHIIDSRERVLVSLLDPTKGHNILVGGGLA